VEAARRGRFGKSADDKNSKASKNLDFMRGSLAAMLKVVLQKVQKLQKGKKPLINANGR
jgi:hypothetical protein